MHLRRCMAWKGNGSTDRGVLAGCLDIAKYFFSTMLEALPNILFIGGLHGAYKRIQDEK